SVDEDPVSSTVGVLRDPRITHHASRTTHHAPRTTMPELPDVVVYLECLHHRVVGQVLDKVRLASPFLLRSVEPPLKQAEGKRVLGLRRLGKRLVFELEDELFLILHLMIAGRLHWKTRGAKLPGKIGLAAFDFTSGTLT